MPNLTNVVVSEFALGHKDDIMVIGGRHSIPLSQLDIGTLALYVPFPSYDYCMSILEGSNEITNLVIGSNACPFENVAAFDLSVYPKLKTLKIGSESFEYVEELKIIGLSELESVEIGKSSFTKEKDWYGQDANRHFYLKNCPKLKSLKIDGYSFSDYTVCEIENVPALETVEIGDLNGWSNNFYYASLELKGGSISRRVMTRHAFPLFTQLWLECIPALLSCCV